MRTNIIKIRFFYFMINRRDSRKIEQSGEGQRVKTPKDLLTQKNIQFDFRSAPMPLKLAKTSTDRKSRRKANYPKREHLVESNK